jgi:hypothetical protein
MRKITIIILLMMLPVFSYACDACGNASTGGYIGILPQYSRHFVGIRYQYRPFSSSSVTSPGSRNNEYYNTWNLWGRMSPHKRVQIYVNVPIHYFLQTDGGVKRELIGPGDIWALAQYQVLRTPDSSKKKMRQSLFMGGGVKLPTGRYNIYDSNGYYDRNLQPGTGSWDFIVTTQYTMRWKGWGMNTEINARISTMNPDNYLYGHKLNANIKGFYWGNAKKISYLFTTGVIYDFGSKDVYLHQNVLNSGGNMVSASASADVYFKRWSIGAELKLPVYTQMSQGLLNPGPQLMSQLMFMF